MTRLHWISWARALPFASAGGGLLCVLAAFVLAGSEPTSAPPFSDAAPLHAALDTAAYVGDQACQSCHADAAAQHRRTGHGRSLSRFDPATAPERFDGETVVYNAASNLYYEAFVRDGALVQREFRKGPDGAVIHEQTFRADYVIGSGNATRSYLMDVNGYLTEMPLTWYTQREVWAMSPGYEEANDRFNRQINVSCMTCHTGRPEHTPFTQNHYTDVPLGITCERCHGPGGEHVTARASGAAPAGEDDPTIVNPADLPRRQQLAVCQQCHLAGLMVFEPGEDPTTFRPGQFLHTNRTVLVPDKQLTDPDWVGIDSHPIRLARSACFKQSAMTCSTCHDAHVPADELTMADYDASCQGCHASTLTDDHAAVPDAATGSCTTCHMAQGGTSDVPHVTFTDHWIRTRPGPPRDPSAGRPSFDTPEPLDLSALRRLDRLTGDVPDGVESTIGYLRFYETMHRQPDYIRRATAPELPADAPSEAFIARARALAEQDDYAAAVRVMERAVADHPQDAWAHYWHGAMAEALGRPEEAIAAYRAAIRIQPRLIEAQMNLAGALVRAGRLAEARDRLQTVVELDPVHQPRAWFNLGLIRAQTGDVGGARDAFERAATLDPDLVPAHIQLGTLYLRAELFEDAIPHFRNAVVADSTNASAVGSLGMAHLQLGRTERARQLFERVLELDPSNEGARTLLEQLREE